MQHRPPVPSPSARRFARLAERAAGLPRRTMWGLILAVLAVVAPLDWSTGRFSIAPLYLFLICLAGWSLGRRQSAIAVALIVGVIVLANNWTTTPFNPANEAWNIASRYISNMVIALLVAGLRDSFEVERWRASTDGLTGALNRAAFTARLATALAAARRQGRTLLLAYVDLDGFKSVNDRHGHAAGDRALCALVDGAGVTADDLVARNGGDEFVLLLHLAGPETGDAAARALHRRLTAALAATGLDVTCSMGAAVLDPHRTEPGPVLIAAADRLMYEAKRAGRNAVRIAGSRADPPDPCAARRPERAEVEPIRQAA